MIDVSKNKSMMLTETDLRAVLTNCTALFAFLHATRTWCGHGVNVYKVLSKSNVIKYECVYIYIYVLVIIK